jgi:hypothetical protein
VKNLNVEGEYFEIFLTLNAEIGGCSENELDLAHFGQSSIGKKINK